MMRLPSPVINLAMFSIPSVAYLLGSLARNAHEYAHLPVSIWLMLLGTGILAYVSNAASLRSLERAPNPGYSLMVSKSSVILTVFLSVPLLHSSLTLQSVFAVFLIVAFSALIMIEPAKNRLARSSQSSVDHPIKTESSWVPLALVAFVGWAFLAMSAKYQFIHGTSTLVFLAVFFIVVTICIILEIQRSRISWSVVRRHWLTVAGIGVLSTTWNFFLFYAIAIAPNPGYVNATNAASIAMLALLAAIIFKDHLSVRKGIGILGVLSGLLVLFLQ